MLSQDPTLVALLGEPLPGDTGISTVYRSTPRLFVAAVPGQLNAEQPHEIRAFVLASADPAGVTLHWRPLGEGAFHAVPATLRSRRAYRAALPVQTRGIVEFYLEATTVDGGGIRWPVTAPALNRTTVVW